MAAAMRVALAPEYWLFGSAGAVSLIAFATLIAFPAAGSFGRPWEKATAVVLSVVVLVAMAVLGVAAGLAVVYFWDDIKSVI